MTVLLTQRCDIVRFTDTLDSIGRATSLEVDVFTNVKCRRDPIGLRSLERVEPGASQGISREIIFTDYRASITTDMRIKLDGDIFHIISVSPILRGTIGHHLEIEVVRVENV